MNTLKNLQILKQFQNKNLQIPIIQNYKQSILNQKSVFNFSSTNNNNNNQNESNKKSNYLKPIIVGVIGLSLGYTIDKQFNKDSCAYKEQQGQVADSTQNKNSNNEEQEQKSIVNLGDSWQLTDVKDKPFSNKDLQGNYYLLYFGFTQCPKICPNALRKIAASVKLLPSDIQENMKSVFVSIDPERDTNERITGFVNLFDENMIGLKSKKNDPLDPEYKKMLKDFRVYSAKIPFENSYTLDHTDFIYLMGPDNQYITPLFSNQEPKEIARSITDKIANFKQKQQ